VTYVRKEDQHSCALLLDLMEIKLRWLLPMMLHPLLWWRSVMWDLPLVVLGPYYPWLEGHILDPHWGCVDQAGQANHNRIECVHGKKECPWGEKYP